MAKRAATVTERQEKWFKSVEEGILRDTGKSLDAWVKIAKDCPETSPRARAKWFKDTYGIGVNRAATILERAFPSAMNWDDPETLLAHLWKEPGPKAIYEKVVSVVEKFPSVTVGPRKGFVGFSRKVQFAAIRPAKVDGKPGARLGLAIPLEDGSRFEAPKKSEGWSERLHTVVMLAGVKDVDAELKALLRAAYERS